MGRQPISKKMRFEVFKRDNFTCQYCGKMAPDVVLEVDHIKPVADGGDNNILNLITSCHDCNRGKGKRTLKDNQELKKQQQQLKELAKKKEQLEMMIKWKEELDSFDDIQVDKIEALNGEYSFSKHGRDMIKKFIRKYGFDEVYESMKIALDKYFKSGNEKSCEEAFQKVGGILHNRQVQKDNPELYEINKLNYKAVHMFHYFDSRKFKRLLFIHKDDLDGEDFITINRLIDTSKNWTEFRESFNDCYCEYLGEKL